MDGRVMPIWRLSLHYTILTVLRCMRNGWLTIEMNNSPMEFCRILFRQEDGGDGSDNGLDWTSTIAIIPWNIYLFYGDSKLLSDCYENIKRYVDYVDRKSPGGLSSWG